MQSMQAIKQRIGSIAVTKQIAQAMHLVANTKIHRARRMVEGSRPFARQHHRLLSRIITVAPWCAGEFCRRADIRKTVYIVIGSDRGLCGAYNVNVGKKTVEQIRKTPGAYEIIAVGSKAGDFFAARDMERGRAYTGITQKPFYTDAKEIGDYVIEKYRQDQVQQVMLVYTEFISMLQYETTVMPLLPIELLADDGYQGQGDHLSLFPGEEALLDTLVPTYVYGSIFNALAEGSACEQSARVTSMDAAVKNSMELIDKLQLKYNEARQEAITNELTEIISGADALAK